MMNEMDLVGPGPFAGQVRHHQFSATHTVSNPVLDIKTDLHLVERLTANEILWWLLYLPEWENNYPA
jgi:hypothetical protein